MYLWVMCVWCPVIISTFLLMFLHQIFYKSAAVIEINMHQMVLCVFSSDIYHFMAHYFLLCLCKKVMRRVH